MMAASLVFCGVSDGLGVRLLEEGENAGGGLGGRFVEESYDVLCAVLGIVSCSLLS